MSAISPAKPDVKPSPGPKPPRRIRRKWVATALLALLVACLLTPPIFQAGMRYGVMYLCRGKGFDVSIRKVGGSIFEPVTFYDVKISTVSGAQTTAGITIDRADVDFSYLGLALRRTGSVRRVTLDGLAGKITFQPVDEPGKSAAKPTATAPVQAPWDLPVKLIPSKIDATRVDLTLQQGTETLRLQNLRFSASDHGPGELVLDRVMVDQKWLHKTFTMIKGAAALQNSRLSVANLTLSPGLVITTASSDLVEMAKGRVKIDFDLAAFEGSIRGELKGTGPGSNSLLEANGVFKQISVPRLAAFLALTGESGGLINEGKFTFLGSPGNLSKATLSVRLEATDFRLGKRQWNSLVGGATMVENHIQIPELKLKQAHNELALKGNMTLPQPGVEWWQSEFAFDIAAKVDNLTELSALAGANFANMAGKVSVDGSITGSNQYFSGELAVAGSGISYQGAPIEKLSASVKLSGNELQVTKLELSNKGDFVRGQGVVNILGEKRYWGELKASVADLAIYSAILQKPVVPQPLAGGFVVDWSGDGVSGAHSGAFHAQLKKFRLISVTEPKAHPLNADMEGTYSPGNMFFSKFLIWDNDTNFSAKVTAAPKTLNLKALRLQQNGELTMEGDALLPFNVWSAWKNASWATLLEFDSPCKVNLAVKNLDLHETALLGGRQFPVKGDLQMNFTAEGTLNEIKTAGRIQLKKAQLTVGDSEPDVIGTDTALTFNNQDVQIEKSVVRFNAREYSTQGTIHFKDLHDPAFELAVDGKKIPVSVKQGIVAETDLDLTLNGKWEEASVTGTAQVSNLKLDDKLDAGALFSPKSSLDLKLVPPFDAGQPPFNQWNFKVALAAGQPAKVLWLSGSSNPPKYDPAGSFTATGAVEGKGADLRLSGVFNMQGIPLSSKYSQWTITQGSLTLPADTSKPTLILAVKGKAGGEDLSGYVFGREDDKIFLFLTNQILSPEKLYKLATTGNSSDPVTAPDFGKTIEMELRSFYLPPGPLAVPFAE